MTVAMTCIGASPGWCRTTWTAVPRSHPPITSYLTITTPSTHTCATKVSPASRCVSPSSHPSRARAPRHLLHSNALRRTLPCASHRHLVHKNALRRMPIPPWLPGPDTPFFFSSTSLHRRAPCCAHARAHEPPRRRAFAFPPPAPQALMTTLTTPLTTPPHPRRHSSRIGASSATLRTASNGSRSTRAPR